MITTTTTTTTRSSGMPPKNKSKPPLPSPDHQSQSSEVEEQIETIEYEHGSSTKSLASQPKTIDGEDGSDPLGGMEGSIMDIEDLQNAGIEEDDGMEVLELDTGNQGGLLDGKVPNGVGSTNGHGPIARRSSAEASPIARSRSDLHTNAEAGPSTSKPSYRNPSSRSPSQPSPKSRDPSHNPSNRSTRSTKTSTPDYVTISDSSAITSRKRKRSRLMVLVTSLPRSELRRYIPLYPPEEKGRSRSYPQRSSRSSRSSRSISIVPLPGGTYTSRSRRKKNDDGSSPDLGGFGSEMSEFESGSASEDGIPRRNMRVRRGGDEVERSMRRRKDQSFLTSTTSPPPLSRHKHRRTVPPPKRRKISTDPESEYDVYDGSQGGEDDDEWSGEEGEGEVDELEDNWDGSEESSEYGRKGRKKKKKGKKSEVKEKESAEEILGRHRQFCEKCSRGPADDILKRALARKAKKGKSKEKKRDDDEVTDEELANDLEGWLECERCVVTSHWGCLTPQQRKNVLDSLRELEGPPPEGTKPRRSILIDEVTGFVCSRCSTYNRCFVCRDEWVRKSVDIASSKKGKGRRGASREEAIVVDGRDGDEDGAQTGGKEGKGVKEDENMGGEGFELLPNGVAGHEKEKVVNGVEKPLANGDTAKAVNGEKEKEKDESMEIDDPIPEPIENQAPLLFRCLRCKQAVHYEHLKNPFPEEESTAEVARYYQGDGERRGHGWFCHQCRGWKNGVDLIIAWRPSPAGAVEPPREDGEKPRYKDALPREYLVKWTDRGFRHVTWVPHPWILATTSQKLRTFLEKGPKLDLVTDETLAARGDDIAEPTIARVLAEDDMVKGGVRGGHHAHTHTHGRGVEKDPEIGLDVNAESSIPVAWSTTDRVLDVMLRPPKTPLTKIKSKSKKLKKGARIISESESEELGLSVAGYSAVDGIEPPASEQIEISAWEMRFGKELDEGDVDLVAPLVSWCLIKWDDLQYDQSTWDTPPPKSSPMYPPFKRALARYLGARRVTIPVLTSAQVKGRENEAAKLARSWTPPEDQPDCIVGGKLMPFQMQGFQWLLTKHYRRESCILADDMGLGKTIQIASVIGYLGYKNIYPSLVVVPNSTITNWVREFEKWVPHLRVVPYYGEAASRKIISKYELYHKGQQNKAAGLKAHVILTTYDMITGNEFRVFGQIPRWEVLCIDEGQRLKSDGSLIFNRLKQLNSVHRILMTGTPLNNNLRELFNLLNFLDEPNFKQLEDLQNRFENLNEGLVTELHEMIKPYILRRIKADVLKLPPMVEIIVPISLAPGIQKAVYKSIIERNAEFLRALADAAAKKARTKKKPIKAVEAPIENGDGVGDGNGDEAVEPVEKVVNGDAASVGETTEKDGGTGAKTIENGIEGDEEAVAPNGNKKTAGTEVDMPSKGKENGTLATVAETTSKGNDSARPNEEDKSTVV